MSRKRRKEIINYDKILVPDTMRSSYWLHFGFPADKDNKIITRQKVICNICLTTISYNQNTSNLRTHLMARHKKQLYNLDNFFSDYNLDGTKKRAKFNASTAATTTVAAANNTQDHAEAVDSAVRNKIEVLTLTPTDLQDDIVEESIETIKKIDVKFTENSLLPCEYQMSVTNTKTQCLATQKQEQEVALYKKPTTLLAQLANADPSVLSALIDDLLSAHVLNGLGMKTLLEQQQGYCCDIRVLEKQIYAAYNKMEAAIRAFVQQKSQDIKYALGFECYRNIEHYEILEIYFNFIDFDNKKFISLLIQRDRVIKINFHKALANLCLSNCSAFIFSGAQQEQMQDFASKYSIPVFQSFDEILVVCMKKAFDLAKMSELFAQICDENEQRQTFDAPVYLNCPWSKYNYLRNAIRYLQKNAQIESAINDARIIIEFMDSLKLVWDVITGEALPFCTLIIPLMAKFFENTKLMQQLKTTFQLDIEQITGFYLRVEAQTQNQQQSKINNNYLKMAQYFDVRLFDFDNENKRNELKIESKILQNQIKEIYADLIEKCTKKTQMAREMKMVKKRKTSRLNSYFKRRTTDACSYNNANDDDGDDDDDSRALIFYQKNSNKCSNAASNAQSCLSFDAEFQSYIVDKHLNDFDECPIAWWQQRRDKYKILYKVAEHYLRVPSFVNRLQNVVEDVNGRAILLEKRFSLRQHCASDKWLWYLHYNKSFHSNNYGK